MKFTARQRQVMEFAVRGVSGKLIARKLGLSPETVKTRVRHVLKESKTPRACWWKLLGYKAEPVVKNRSGLWYNRRVGRRII